VIHTALPIQAMVQNAFKRNPKWDWKLTSAKSGITSNKKWNWTTK
jgi:hypothetical protein